MNKFKLFQILAIVLLMVTGQTAIAGNGAGPGKGARANNAITSPLSNAEAAALTFMREEEKLARDVYRVLFDQWGNRVFTNISDSEQRHMNSMEKQLNIYHLPDPVVDDYTGVFTNTDLAGLFVSLTDRGRESLEQALHVGALIEELDMQDLQNAIDESTHAGLVAAYEELIRGSRNHLRAFVGQIENLGIVYEAQLLEQEQVDAIINEPLERG